MFHADAMESPSAVADLVIDPCRRASQTCLVLLAQATSRYVSVQVPSCPRTRL